MFKLERKISSSDLSSDALFIKASNSVEKLIARYSVLNSQIQTDSDKRTITFTGDKFEGYIRVNGNEMEIFSHFKKLLSFNKSELEKELDLWIQEIFSARYEM